MNYLPLLLILLPPPNTFTPTTFPTQTQTITPTPLNTFTPTTFPAQTQTITPNPTDTPTLPPPSIRNPKISLDSIAENPNGSGFVLDFSVSGGTLNSIVIKRDGTAIATVSGSTMEYIDSGTTKSPKNGDTIVYEVDAIIGSKVVSISSMTLSPLPT